MASGTLERMFARGHAGWLRVDCLFGRPPPARHSGKRHLHCIPIHGSIHGCTRLGCRRQALGGAHAFRNRPEGAVQKQKCS